MADPLKALNAQQLRLLQRQFREGVRAPLHERAPRRNRTPGNSRNCAVVQCTSETKFGDYYPGVWIDFEATTATVTPQASCLLFAMNSGALSASKNYDATWWGEYVNENGDSVPVYLVEEGGATGGDATFVNLTATSIATGSITVGGVTLLPLRVKEGDDDPNVYPVNVIVVEETHLAVTDDTGGQITLSWLGVGVLEDGADIGIEPYLDFIENTYITWSCTDNQIDGTVECETEWVGVCVRENDSDRGIRPCLNFLDTDFIFFNVTEDAGNTEMEIEAEWAGVAVRKEGTLVDTYPTLNFHEGSSNVTLTITADAGNEEIDIDIAVNEYPTFSGCIATRTNQTISDSTETDVLFDTEVEDTDTYHSTSSNTERFTVPATGRYIVKAEVAWAGDADGYRTVLIEHSSLGVIATSQVANTGASDSLGHHAWARSPSVTAGSYFKAVVEQTSGGNLQMTAARFEIHRIS